MDFPDEQRLKETIERLTRENAKLRTQLAVAQQWNPPLDLEQAFRSARGWQCLTVPLIPEQPTLILISGAKPEKEGETEDEAAAGEVWRHLQTAAAPGGRIGPFARARMPRRLLGYLREQSGRTIIVLNRDLRRGQVSQAARMLRESAKRGRPTTRLLELSAIPLLSLCALFHGDMAKGAVGISAAAAAPAATIILPAAVASALSPNLDAVTIRQHPPSHTRPVDRAPAWPPGTGPVHGLNPSR